MGRPGCGMRWLVFGQCDTSCNNLARGLLMEELSPLPIDL